MVRQNVQLQPESNRTRFVAHGVILASGADLEDKVPNYSFSGRAPKKLVDWYQNLPAENSEEVLKTIQCLMESVNMNPVWDIFAKLGEEHSNPTTLVLIAAESYRKSGNARSRGELNQLRKKIAKKAADLAALLRETAFDIDAQVAVVYSRMKCLDGWGTQNSQSQEVIDGRKRLLESHWPDAIEHPRMSDVIEEFGSTILNDSRVILTPLITKKGQNSAKRTVFVRSIMRKIEHVLPPATSWEIKYQIVAGLVSALFDEIVDIALIKKLVSQDR